MKKLPLFLLTAYLTTTLAACDSSGIEVNPPQSTTLLQTTTAVTEAPLSPQTERKEEFPHRLDNLYWYENFSTDEERSEYIRSYFKSEQYAEDHPDFPDVLWIPDNGRLTVPEPWEMPPNDTFADPCLLNALEDDEKIGLIVSICREDPQQYGAVDLQAEKDYFTSEGFTVVADISSDPSGFAIVIQKSQYEALATLVPYEPGAEHYLIGVIGYSELAFSDTQ